MLAGVTALVAATALAVALVVAAPGAPSPPDVAAGASASASRSPGEPTGVDVAAPAPATASHDVSALQAALSKRAAAVLSGDESQWLAPLAEPTSAYGMRQSQLFQRLRHVPFTAYSYHVQGEISRDSGEVAGLQPAQWVADVRLNYRMDGDTRDVKRRVPLILTGPADAPRIVGDATLASGSTPMRDLWELTDVAVVRAERSILIGDQRRARSLKRYSRLVDAAVADVDRLWGTGWRRTVVVVVPHSGNQMAAVLGRSGTNGLGQLAAVTTGEIDRPEGSAGPVTTADRVILNPDAFDSSADDERRRQVVLTHEMTHVATRGSVLIGPPLWLEEAFADFVGYRSGGIDRNDVAEHLLADVRAGHGPTRLPDENAFDPTKTAVDDAYIESWLALDMIESERGTSGVVAFYRTATGLEAAPAGAAMTREAALARAYQRLGTDAAGFERQWLAYLARLAQ